MNYINSRTSWKPTDSEIDIQNMAYDLTWLIEVVERIAKTY